MKGGSMEPIPVVVNDAYKDRYLKRCSERIENGAVKEVDGEISFTNFSSAYLAESKEALLTVEQQHRKLAIYRKHGSALMTMTRVMWDSGLLQLKED